MGPGVGWCPLTRGSWILSPACIPSHLFTLCLPHMMSELRGATPQEFLSPGHRIQCSRSLARTLWPPKPGLQRKAQTAQVVRDSPVVIWLVWG